MSDLGKINSVFNDYDCIRIGKDKEYGGYFCDFIVNDTQSRIFGDTPSDALERSIRALRKKEAGRDNG
ncbi:MAG: hypothetical protein ACXQTJ_06770 [Candidatus Syntropharchaeales archaeon]